MPADFDLDTPMEQVIASFAVPGPYDVTAAGLCLLRFEEAGPLLREFLAGASAGDWTNADANVVFAAVHILGAHRDSRSFPALVKLLRRPGGDLDALLGDACTETLPRIVAGMFNGDAETLFDLAADPGIDEFIRAGLLGALAFLTWDKRIERAKTAAFLERFFDERMAADGDFAWSGWADAVALLGLHGVVPRVEQAWREKRIAEDVDDHGFWIELLARADAEPDNYQRFRDQHLGYIDDLAEVLERFSALSNDFGDPPPRGEPDYLFWPPSPWVDPWRHVGRNDPCPCGSGKKFKKCCLGREPD